MNAASVFGGYIVTEFVAEARTCVGQRLIYNRWIAVISVFQFYSFSHDFEPTQRLPRYKANCRWKDTSVSYPMKNNPAEKSPSSFPSRMICAGMLYG